MVEEKQENPLHAKEEGRAEGSSEETTGNGRSLGVFSFEGDIPLTQAVPLGLQHVLAMFVGNLTPLFNLYDHRTEPSFWNVHRSHLPRPALAPAKQTRSLHALMVLNLFNRPELLLKQLSIPAIIPSK